MQKKLYLSFIILLFSFLSLSAQQDRRTRETKIADIVMQLPAKNTADLNKLMDELIQLGDVIPNLTPGLADPGQGDDSQIRNAISGLVFHVSKNSNPAYKKQLAVSICKAIPNAKSDEIRDFLLIQLQYIAGDESVQTVKNYLTNDRLCDAAVRILVRVNNEDANRTMFDALQSASDQKQLSLIEGLGYTQYLPALDLISQQVGSSDIKVRKTALFALSHIASPSSMELMTKAAEKAAYTFESSDALDAYIVYLNNLLKSNQQEFVTKASKDLLKKLSVPGQTAAKCAALDLYTRSAGEKAISEITGALKSNDIRYREAALVYSANIQSPKMNEALLNVAKSAKPEIKTEVIRFFGNKGDAGNLPFVFESLKNKDPEIVIAAITAVGKLGQEQAIVPVIKAMNSQNQEIVEAGKIALLSIKSLKVVDEVAKATPPATPLAKAALIGILAERQSVHHNGLIISNTSAHEKVVSDAAYKALKSVVTKDQLPALVFKLTAQTTATQGNIADVQEAIVAAVRGTGDKNQQVQQILDQQYKPEDRKLLFRPLAMVGGEKALAVVTEGFRSNEESVRSTAFEALTEWKGGESAPALLVIARANSAGNYFNKALNSFIGKVNQSNYPDAQKLLLFRDALDIAQTPAQKKECISGIARTGTFTGLITAGKYLDDSNLEVQQAAVQAIRIIALGHKEYYGKIVTDLLNKAMAVNKDPEADYQKQAILKHIAALPQEEGFASMFNGKDLTGWKGLVENPVARSKMTPAQLAEKQAKADEIMRRDWKVENSLLVFEGKGYDNLCSAKNYGDFEMYVDWKIGPEGDAGIYLRGSPQVQIWDTSLVKVGAQVGSGGLYNNQRHPSKPLVVADNAVNEWNSFYIRMIGEKVTVYLNGQLVVDNITLENYWDRKSDIFPSDAIELQAHGSRVEYRDIYVREIPRPKAYEVSEEEKKDGFVPMFNGIDMSGWVGNLKDYVAKEGKIICDPTYGGRGNLYTDKEYANFTMRFEFLLTPAANNGLGIRAPLTGDAAYLGMELQILDNDAEVYKNLHEYQYHGSVYGVIASKRGFLKPLGEWNTQEVIANGNHIKITLNGTVILDGDIAEASNNFTKTIDGQSHPGLSNKSGHIGFLGHGSYVEFKNLRIKVLDDDSKNEKTKKTKK